MVKKVYFDAANYISQHAPRTGIYRYIEGLFAGIDDIKGRSKPECTILSESPVADDFEYLHDKIIYSSHKMNKLRFYTFKYPSLIHYFYKLENFINPVKQYDIYHVLDISNFTHYKQNITTFYDITPVIHPQWHMERVIAHHSYKFNIAKKKSLKIVSISENTKKDLVCHGIKEENIKVTPLAVPIGLQKFINAPSWEVGNLKKKYPYPFLLSVCTIEPRKNIAFLIDSFISLKENDNYNDLKLVLVGKHGWGDKTFSQHPDIIFTDFIGDDELVCLYKLAKAFIYPSLYEGFGLPVLEAMASGSPVITSRVSSMPEIGGDSVIYIDPIDKEDLVDKMIQVIEDDDYCASLRTKGLERSKLFSWTDTARKTLDAYDYFFS